MYSTIRSEARGRRSVEYMRSSEPGSHQSALAIAEAIGANRTSVSGALTTLSRDKWLHIVKIRRGVWSYRPLVSADSYQDSYQETLPKTDPGPSRDLLDELATAAAEENGRQRQLRQLAERPDGPAPVPVAPAVIEGLTPGRLADLERIREKRETRQEWYADQVEKQYQGGTLGEGMYRELTVTSQGTTLVENAKGELFELLPLRRPT